MCFIRSDKQIKTLIKKINPHVRCPLQMFFDRHVQIEPWFTTAEHRNRIIHCNLYTNILIMMLK